MGILRSIFGSDFKEPLEERWSEIINFIHSKLTAERQTFFAACVEILEMLPDVSIRSRTMSPRIELGVLVYQLHLGRELIAAKQYVRPENGKRFVNMLYSDACRYGSILERDALMKRYWPRPNNSGSEIFAFYDDLVQYISGGDGGLNAIMLLTENTARRFTIAARLAVSTAFGDKATTRELLEAAGT